MRNILVTGGGGFIGFHLCVKLAEDAGSRVVIVENFSRGQRDADLASLAARPNVELVEADLSAPGALDAVSGPFDEIYHLAAVVGVKHCASDPARVLRVNLLATMNVVDYAAERGGKLFFSSTSEAYSGAHDLGLLPIPTPEDVPMAFPDPGNPRSSYAVSKLAGEQYVRFCGDKHGFSYAIGRYHNVYGPRMGYAHVIPEVVKRVIDKEDPFRLIGGDQTRAFCHVDDAIRATLGVMKSGGSGEVYHIGNDQETRIRDLIGTIFEHFSCSPRTVEIPAPRGSVERRCPDISKLRARTGYEPRIPLGKGLPEVCSWYEKALATHGVWE